MRRTRVTSVTGVGHAKQNRTPRCAWLDSRGGCPYINHCDPMTRYFVVVNASVSSVFCSTSCALALPVDGLALEERFTESTGRSPAIRRRRGSMLKRAPMLAG